jgi:hypothetical protein
MDNVKKLSDSQRNCITDKHSTAYAKQTGACMDNISFHASDRRINGKGT